MAEPLITAEREWTLTEKIILLFARKIIIPPTEHKQTIPRKRAAVIWVARDGKVSVNSYIRDNYTLYLFGFFQIFKLNIYDVEVHWNKNGGKTEHALRQLFTLPKINYECRVWYRVNTKRTSKIRYCSTYSRYHGNCTIPAPIIMVHQNIPPRYVEGEGQERPLNMVRMRSDIFPIVTVVVILLLGLYNMLSNYSYQ